MAEKEFKTIKFSEPVLHCKFSPNGRFLAIGGTNGLCQIFRIEQKFNFKLVWSFTDLRTAVSCLSWSRNSRYLLVCGSTENGLDGCVYCAEETHIVLDFDILNKPLTNPYWKNLMGANACDWFDDNQTFVIGDLKGRLAVFVFSVKCFFYIDS